MKIKIYYILPSFNENLNIPKLIRSFKKFYEKKKISISVVFIDDGSTDDTLKTLKKLKRNIHNNIKIKVLKHKKNLGLGKALETGFKHVFKIAKNQDIIITMDTDNSHTIQLSYDLINEIINKKKDIVIASRFIKGSNIQGLKISRKILSYIAAILFKIFYPIKNIRDYTSGFRAFKVNQIRPIFNNNKNFFSETGFSVSADILLKLYPFKTKLKFSELPINLRYDLKKGDSKMKVLRTIYLNLKILILRKIS